MRKSLIFCIFIIVAAWGSIAQGHDDKGANIPSETKAKQGVADSRPIIVQVQILPTPKTETDAKREEEERSERKAAEILKQKTDDDLVKFTGKLAWYTWLLVIVGGLQGCILIAQGILFYRQENATKTIERAYVKMSHMPPGLEYAKGGFWGITVKVQHTGPTPAKVTDAIFDWRVVPKDGSLPTIPPYDVPGYQRRREPQPIEAFLVRGDEIGYAVPFQITEDTASITDPDNFTNKLYVFGYIDYIDVFGKRHRAGYGRVYEPSRDVRGAYKSDADYEKRSNLTFVPQPRYNYDKKRKKSNGKEWDKPN